MLALRVENERTFDNIYVHGICQRLMYDRLKVFDRTIQYDFRKPHRNFKRGSIPSEIGFQSILVVFVYKK